MQRQELEPSVTLEPYTGNETRERHEHDAFGVITMSSISGGDPVMFGSDLRHDHRLRFEIKRASLDRHLSRDWIHAASNPIVEFEMSHSQFAEFITSVGKGSGTPVTLLYAPARDTETLTMPSIKKIESKHDTFKREIEESTQKQVSAIKEQVEKLGKMLDTGKLGIKDTRELHREMSIIIGNLPANMSFVIEQAEEALEKATTDAKIEVEAYINATAKKLGLQTIEQLGTIAIEHEKIEHKK